jgi:hypothetical protein
LLGLHHHIKLLHNFRTIFLQSYLYLLTVHVIQLTKLAEDSWIKLRDGVIIQSLLVFVVKIKVNGRSMVEDEVVLAVGLSVDIDVGT